MFSNLYSISEFAELSRLSRKTLIYYDNIDLLKPYYVEGNKYRYYHKNQVLTAKLIRTYKRTGLSLEQIRNLLYSSTSNEIDDIMDHQIDIINSEIRELTTTLKILKQTRNNKMLLEKHPLGALFYHNIPESDVIIEHYTQGMDYSYFLGTVSGGVFYLKGSKLDENPDYIFRFTMFDDEKPNGVIDGGRYICSFVETITVHDGIEEFIRLVDEKGIRTDERYIFIDISNDMILNESKKNILLVGSRII